MTSPQAPNPKRVLFVCLGNICRSPTAEGVFRAMAKAEVTDADAFRAALEAADFTSVRGDFKFNTNHHPIQDIYAREVIQEGDIFTNKIMFNSTCIL